MQMITKPKTKRTNPEAVLQSHLTGTLKVLGYTIMETGKSRSAVMCPHCKGRHYATGWQGNTVGLPDLYIHRTGWTLGMAVALELKAPTGKVRPEQQQMADAGMSIIVRTLSDGLRHIRDVEERLGNTGQARRINQMLESSWLLEEKDIVQTT